MTSRLFSGRTTAQRPHISTTTMAASGTGKIKAPASKTSKVKAAARKTKKLEVDDDTSSTIGALGIFGTAVATAGFLFVNNTSEILSPSSDTTVATPEPIARSVPLPSADTGTKVKSSFKEAAQPAPAVKADAEVVEEKPAPPPEAAYVAPPAIKVDKSQVATSTQGSEIEVPDTVKAITKAPDAPEEEIPTISPPKPPAATPVAKAPVAEPPSKPAAAPASSSGSSSISPAVLGGVAVVALAAVAAAATGTTAEGETPAAPAPAASGAMTSEASMEERVKDRQAWIAAYRARQ